MHLLDGLRHKVFWASKHIAELEAIFSSINNPKISRSTLRPYSVVGDLDTIKNEYIYRVRVVNESCILDVKILLGQTVYLLRSALDNLVWQLARINFNSPSKRIEFPIYRTRPNNAKTRREYEKKIIELPPPAREIIEALQPYHKGSSADYDPLALLDELCNIDKHRGLNPVAVYTGIPILPYVNIENEGVNEGDIIARVPAKLNPEVAFKPYVFFSIALPIKGLKGDNDITILRNIQEYIRDSVLPSFDNFFLDH